MNNEMDNRRDNPIISFTWKDYSVEVFSINEDDGFIFSSIDYCGEQWNNRMSSREEYELYKFTIKKLKECNMP